MNSTDIAKAIAAEILSGGSVWLFLLLTAFVAGAGAYFGKYLGVKASNLATKEDFHSLHEQLGASTRLVESVKTEIASADWAAREWRTTRRLKLEELLFAAYSLDLWIEMQRSKWMEGATIEADEIPMERVQLLVNLYFPELKAEAFLVKSAYLNAMQFILSLSQRSRDSRIDGDLSAYQIVLNEFVGGWKPLYQTAQHAISALESRASTLMTEIAGV
jgi:hypothetical protein